MARAWMRILQVKFTNKDRTKQIVLGSNWIEGKGDLNIEVTGSKYMSSLKDECTIRISNLTYDKIILLTKDKYYDVEIQCGYRHSNVFTIFRGGVLYISNSITDIKSNTVIILCASQLIAKYGQSRMNLTLNSGINLYSALNYVCKKAGIPNTNISTQFKKDFISNISTVNTTIAQYFQSLAENDDKIMMNTNSITNSVISIFDASKSNLRTIRLTQDMILLAGGYPQLTSDGVSLSIMPTFDFMCGDVIEIDNSLIQIPVTSRSNVSKNYSYFLDHSGREGYGKYMIYEMSFRLCNRSSNFSINIKARTRSLISNFTGK